MAGLRLAVLSLRERTDLERIVEDLADENRYVMDYIITEVLSKQPPTLRDYLLSTALLNRFCAPLCEAVCAADDETGTGMITGSEFIDQLEQTNLFVIPLDDQRRWYRYHHLFQQLLQGQLKKRFRPDETSATATRSAETLISTHSKGMNGSKPWNSAGRHRSAGTKPTAFNSPTGPKTNTQRPECPKAAAGWSAPAGS